MEADKKIDKRIQELYRKGVNERLKTANMLRRNAGRLAALNTSTDQPFKVIGVYLERINKSLGEDAVVKASALISLFDNQFTYEKAQSVALDLARIADYNPKKFNESINHITMVLRENGTKAAAKVSFEFGSKAVTDSLKGKVSDDVTLLIRKELSYSHVI